MKLCEICGDPMPPNEQMFKFHGYSGKCPKPPLKKKTLIFQIEKSVLHNKPPEQAWHELLKECSESQMPLEYSQVWEKK